MSKLYLRREPTTDPATPGARRSKHYTDIVGYADRDCVTELTRWRWWSNSKPTKNRPARPGANIVTINGEPFEVEWLAPKLLEGGAPCYP